jgi:hypothetical protein
MFIFAEESPSERCLCPEIGDAIARHNERNAKYPPVLAMNAVNIGCNIPHDTSEREQGVSETS